MKLILLGLALLQLVSCERDERLSPRGYGIDSSFYQEAKYYRADYAIEHNIANMNRVEYDMELEDLIAEEVAIHGYCPEEMYIRKRNVSIYLGTKGYKTLGDEPYLAGHTRVALIWTVCEDKNNEVISMSHIAFDVPIHPVIYGTPGSQCAPGWVPVGPLCNSPYPDDPEESENATTPEILPLPSAEELWGKPSNSSETEIQESK